MKYIDRMKTTVIKLALNASFKFPSRLPLPLGFFRHGMEISSVIFKARSDVHIESISLGGVSAECLMLKQNVNKTDLPNYAFLHLHGGVFVAGSVRTHRAIGSEIAARSTAAVYMLDYRLAPEHPYPAAFDDCLAAYQALLAKGYRPEHIVLGGDSAGGALVLALLIELRDRNIALPAAVVMISPFLDMTLCGSSFEKNKWRDPMLSKEILQRGADAYRGEIQSADARISPILADLSGLPPMLIQVGSEEVLLDDALQLAKHAERSGVKVEHHVYDGMWHNFQMFNALLKTSDYALDEIAQFIQKHVQSS